MFFLDPRGGRRRRNVLRDRVAAVPRRLRRRLARKAGLVRARAGEHAGWGLCFTQSRILPRPAAKTG